MNRSQWYHNLLFFLFVLHLTV